LRSPLSKTAGSVFCFTSQIQLIKNANVANIDRSICRYYGSSTSKSGRDFRVKFRPEFDKSFRPISGLQNKDTLFQSQLDFLTNLNFVGLIKPVKSGFRSG